MALVALNVLVLLITSFSSTAALFEPKCSELHVLEQLLEKMVRMENKMDTYSGNAKKDVELLRKEIEQQKDVTETLISNSESVFEKEIRKTNGEIANTNDKLQLLAANLQELSKQEGLSTKFKKQEPVVFVARIQREVRDTSAKQPILFTAVDLNLGNGYDATTGIFTAPVQGVYVFSLSILSGNNKTIEVHLVKDATRLVGAYANSNGLNARDQGATVTVTQLAVGNKVWASRNMPPDEGVIAGWRFSSFSGYLLSSM